VERPPSGDLNGTSSEENERHFHPIGLDESAVRSTDGPGGAARLAR